MSQSRLRNSFDLNDFNLNKVWEIHFIGNIIHGKTKEIIILKLYCTYHIIAVVLSCYNLGWPMSILQHLK